MIIYGRWNKRPTRRNTQTFECDPCKTSVVGPAVDEQEAEKHLRHAKEQLELERHYPGRKPG
jgi:hypothetical protein